MSSEVLFLSVLALTFSVFLGTAVYDTPEIKSSITCTVQKWDAVESIYIPRTVVNTAALGNPTYHDALLSAFIEHRNVFGMAVVVMFIGISTIVAFFVTGVFEILKFLFGIFLYVRDMGRAYEEARIEQNARIGAQLREKDD